MKGKTVSRRFIFFANHKHILTVILRWVVNSFPAISFKVLVLSQNEKISMLHWIVRNTRFELAPF